MVEDALAILHLLETHPTVASLAQLATICGLVVLHREVRENRAEGKRGRDRLHRRIDRERNKRRRRWHRLALWRAGVDARLAGRHNVGEPVAADQPEER